MPVQPVASLGQCALAIRRAGLHRACANIYQTSDSLARLCNASVEFRERIDDVCHDFLQGVERLTWNELQRGKDQQRNVIVVAHREAFYGELYKRTGEALPYKPPYCVIGEFLVAKQEPAAAGKGGNSGGTSSGETKTMDGDGGRSTPPPKNKVDHLAWHLVEFDVGYSADFPTEFTGSRFPKVNRTLNVLGKAAQLKSR